MANNLLTLVDFSNRQQVKIMNEQGEIIKFIFQEGLHGLSIFKYKNKEYYLRSNFDADVTDDINDKWDIFMLDEDRLICVSTNTQKDEAITLEDLRCDSPFFAKWFNPVIYGDYIDRSGAYVEEGN